MAFFQIVKGLKFSYLLQIFWVSLQHPFFAWKTFWATKDTFKTVQELYPGIHGKENAANAFRHALWNMFIAKGCLRYTSNIEKALNWAKKITDLHEELAPNRPISKAMDLKNNALGRNWIRNNNFKTKKQVLLFLKVEANKAIKVASIEDIKKANQLVYLED